MKRDEAKNELAKCPELVPLSEVQRKSFLFFWNERKDYKSRQELINGIPDLYNNRYRYRDLLTEREDIDTFNAILRDGSTRF